MEGVLVSAKRRGSTITITVVTDEEGQYRFPEGRLEPGRYALSIHATGYELGEDTAADISARATVTADLNLHPATDLASQLSNAEWLVSVPGTDEQRRSIVRCGHCHLIQLPLMTHYDADAWMPVLERMAGYPPLAFPLMPQLRPAPQIGGGPPNPAQREQQNRRVAEYLATINLSSTSERKYPLKTFPRPTGKATEVIYTTYDLSPLTRQPHDVIVDSDGMAWYASFGEQILAKLDPNTGQVTEYEIPLLKPGAPTGILGVHFDASENIWMAMQFQGGVAKFDPKSETFQTWPLPAELDGDYVQINQLSPEYLHVDGKLWLVEVGSRRVLRLDTVTGEYEAFDLFGIPRPTTYDVISDAQNNAYFTVMGREHIGRIDAETGAISLYETPTPRSAPRRGSIDAQGRFWFAENRGDKIGMFDPRTEQFQEWQVPTPFSLPYDVVADKHGHVWAGGEYTDRILRLDPETDEFTEYVLPGFVNVRRVFVDNRPTPVAFWVGATHTASIVKLEPLDASSAVY